MRPVTARRVASWTLMPARIAVSTVSLVMGVIAMLARKAAEIWNLHVIYYGFIRPMRWIAGDPKWDKIDLVFGVRPPDATSMDPGYQKSIARSKEAREAVMSEAAERGRRIVTTHNPVTGKPWTLIETMGSMPYDDRLCVSYALADVGRVVSLGIVCDTCHASMNRVGRDFAEAYATLERHAREAGWSELTEADRAAMKRMAGQYDDLPFGMEADARVDRVGKHHCRDHRPAA